MKAAAIVGIDRKNENSAADRLDAPSASAPTIVAPDRDTPGIIARHWMKPIFSPLNPCLFMPKRKAFWAIPAPLDGALAPVI